MLIEELVSDACFNELPVISMLNDMQFSFSSDDLYGIYLSTFLCMNLHDVKCCCRCYGLRRY